MSAGPRDRMIDTAIRLLAERGYQATSFGEVVNASGAPRGSIYHHFPGGKRELVTDALRRQGDQAIAALDRLDGRPADEVIDGFVSLWSALLTATDFAVGCSLLAVVVSGDDPALDADADAIFRRWRARLAEVLAGGGLSEDEAPGFATLLLAACEGAVVMARAAGDLAPLEQVRLQLRSFAALRPAKGA